MDKIRLKEHIDGLDYIWYGGHGVHIHQGGKEVEMFNVGDFSKNEATRKEVKAGIKRWHKEQVLQEA